MSGVRSELEADPQRNGVKIDINPLRRPTRIVARKVADKVFQTHRHAVCGKKIYAKAVGHARRIPVSSAQIKAGHRIADDPVEQRAICCKSDARLQIDRAGDLIRRQEARNEGIIERGVGQFAAIDEIVALPEIADKARRRRAIIQ